MKILTIILYFFFFSLQATAQQNSTSYAIVVGISAYQNPTIPSLQFASRDASVFAEYLSSASGGSVPKANINLLIDSMATSAALHQAVFLVTQQAKKGDRVYFYFSGHGDMENVTMFNNGYLICYNTPPINYVHTAFSIDYLNQIANTISVKTGAQVVLITDACHSGKLSGEINKTAQLVGNQLQTIKDNEIRIASCEADQLSQENVLWGGGRGVFSYYLLNGLLGEADNNKDQQVNTEELSLFLKNALAKDPVLKSNAVVQTPVVKGPAGFTLSMVNEVALRALKERNLADSVSNLTVSLLPPAPPTEENLTDKDFFTRLLYAADLEQMCEALKISSGNEYAGAALNFLYKMDSVGSNKARLQALKEKISSDDFEKQQINSLIATAFDDKGQAIINAYLAGDEAELERRQYYNQDVGYQVYVDMFEQAVKLTDKKNFFHNIVLVKYHYFKGLTQRLRILYAEKPLQLLDSAFAQQKLALALEEHAAYIYNELGILYQYKNQLETATKFYQKAADLSPRWALPRANLAITHTLRNELVLARKSSDLADSICGNCHTVIIARGLVNVQSKNLLFAEEDFRNAIEVNDRSFLPFEELAKIYTRQAKFALADSFFYEASLRKKGLRFTGTDWKFYVTAVASPSFEIDFCNVDTAAALREKNVTAIVVWGIQRFKANDYFGAKEIFKIAIGLDTNAVLVFHYLGRIAFDEKQWEQAEIYFSLAKEKYKTNDELKIYLEEQEKKFVLPTCVGQSILKNNYNAVEDNFFLGNIFSQRGYFDRAELIYKNQIRENSADLSSIKLLEEIFIKENRITEAEALWFAYKKINPEVAEKELKGLYELQMQGTTQEIEWPYKLGLLMYDRASLPSKVFFLDSIVYFPKLKREIATDLRFLVDSASLAQYRLEVNNKYPQIKKTQIILDAIESRTLVTAGTGQEFILQPDFWTPRIDAIRYLKAAVRLAKDDATVADLNYKIANLYKWAGSMKQAYPFYENAASLQLNSAKHIAALLEAAKTLFKNREYLSLLQRLEKKENLNFNYRILYAEALANKGNLNEASRINQIAEQTYPYKNERLIFQQMEAAKLNGRYAEAIKLLKTLPHFKSRDEANAQYHLASLYAINSEQGKAITELKLAIDLGFNLFFVLENDIAWNKFKKNATWQKLNANLIPKKYAVVN